MGMVEQKSYVHIRVSGTHSTETTLSEIASKLGVTLRYTRTMIGGRVKSGFPFITLNRLELSAIDDGRLLTQLQKLQSAIPMLKEDVEICVQVCVADDEVLNGLFFSEELISNLATIQASLDVSIGLIA